MRAHELSEGVSFFANINIPVHWYNHVKLDLGKVMTDPKKMVRVELHDLLTQAEPGIADSTHNLR